MTKKETAQILSEIEKLKVDLKALYDYLVTKKKPQIKKKEK